jgi:VanZ family protein
LILRPWTWPAFAKRGAFALANAILLFLCLAPSKSLPGEPMWDKAEHGLAWTILAAVAMLLWPARPRRIALYTLSLGALVEVLQATLPFGRDGAWQDWIADAVGVALALIGYAAARAVARR